MIELLIAMALVAIVSAFAVPQFQRYTANENLKTAAREVAGDFFNIRQKAMGNVTNAYSIAFDVGANSYSLNCTGSTCASEFPRTKSPASFGSGSRLESVHFSGTTVSFQKRGTLSNGGHLFLINSLGSRAKVTVNFTGRTYVEFFM